MAVTVLGNEWMTNFLSEEDLQRIKEFNATPKYEREPEMLVPNDD